ncbi:MAG TPA: putative lipid II flippase FtsW [Chlamydiales bacterium]|nr:putative lipid II flippase FtsW [Chlamydiales bacterium]
MKNTSIWLICSVALLFSFGLLMVFNTTSAEILERTMEGSTHAPLFRQFLYGTIGIGAGIFAYFLGYDFLLKNSHILLCLAICMLILLYIPGLGQTINGSRRWLGFAGFSFQPSECIKILVPLVYIRWYMAQTQVQFKDFLQILGFLMIPITLILFQPDHGTTAILFSLLIVLFFLTKIRLAYWALPLLLVMGAGVWGAYRLPYVQSRIQVYLHPELDLRGKGHQPHQAKIAAGSGKLFGRGLGESLQKLNYLPEARSDYIAAIYAEEMGFFGILGLIAVYLTLTFSGVAIAMRARDQAGYLIASILTFLISIQAFLNLGIVSGLLPSKGTTLPFFSQGGSSLVVNLIAFFLILGVSRKHERAEV